MYSGSDAARIEQQLLMTPNGMEVVERRPSAEVSCSVGGALKVVWQPGDGTRYEVYAAHAPEERSSQDIVVGCSVGNTTFFMVVVPSNGFLSELYVREKGFGSDRGQIIDSSHTTKIMTYLCGILCDRQTAIDFGRA